MSLTSSLLNGDPLSWADLLRECESLRSRQHQQAELSQEPWACRTQRISGPFDTTKAETLRTCNLVCGGWHVQRDKGMKDERWQLIAEAFHWERCNSKFHHQALICTEAKSEPVISFRLLSLKWVRPCCISWYLQHVHVWIWLPLLKSDYDLWSSALLTKCSGISNFLCVVQIFHFKSVSVYVIPVY